MPKVILRVLLDKEFGCKRGSTMKDLVQINIRIKNVILTVSP